MATATATATEGDTTTSSIDNNSISNSAGCQQEVLPVWLVPLAAICGASIALLLASIVFMSCYFCHKFNAYQKYRYNDLPYHQHHQNQKDRYSNIMNTNAIATNISHNNNNNQPISRSGGTVQVHNGIDEMMIDTKDLHPHQRNLHSPHRRYMMSTPYLLPNNTSNNSQGLQTSTFGMFSSKNIQIPQHPPQAATHHHHPLPPFSQQQQRPSQHCHMTSHSLSHNIPHNLQAPASLPPTHPPLPASYHQSYPQQNQQSESLYQQKYTIDGQNPYDVHNTFLNSFTKGLTMSNVEIDKSKQQILSSDFVQHTREDFSKALGNGTTQYIITPVFTDTMSKLRKETSQNKSNTRKKSPSVSSPTTVTTTTRNSPSADPRASSQSRIPKQYSEIEQKTHSKIKDKNHHKRKTRIPRSPIVSNSQSPLTTKSSDIELEPATSEEVAAVPESLLIQDSVNNVNNKFKGRVTPATEMNQWLERNRYGNKSYASTVESDFERTASTSTNTPTKSIPGDIPVQETSDYEYEFDGRNSITPDLTKQKMQLKSPQDVLNTTKDLLDWLELKIDHAKTPVGERSEWSMPRTSVSPKSLHKTNNKAKKKKKQDLEATFDSLGSK